ncbi:MAG: hypothetical protein DWI25_03035 [Planctomycetota bacterium]|nr:MAG: hypothetical protein DWI25_03035 [Planctomycetota bacterium]
MISALAHQVELTPPRSTLNFLLWDLLMVENLRDLIRAPKLQKYLLMLLQDLISNLMAIYQPKLLLLLLLVKYLPLMQQTAI